MRLSELKRNDELRLLRRNGSDPELFIACPRLVALFHDAGFHGRHRGWPTVIYFVTKEKRHEKVFILGDCWPVVALGFAVCALRPSKNRRRRRRTRRICLAAMKATPFSSRVNNPITVNQNGAKAKTKKAKAKSPKVEDPNDQNVQPKPRRVLLTGAQTQGLVGRGPTQQATTQESARQESATRQSATCEKTPS